MEFTEAPPSSFATLSPGLRSCKEFYRFEECALNNCAWLEGQCKDPIYLIYCTSEGLSIFFRYPKA